MARPANELKKLMQAGQNDCEETANDEYTELFAFVKKTDLSDDVVSMMKEQMPAFLKRANEWLKRFKLPALGACVIRCIAFFLADRLYHTDVKPQVLTDLIETLTGVMTKPTKTLVILSIWVFGQQDLQKKLLKGFIPRIVHNVVAAMNKRKASETIVKHALDTIKKLLYQIRSEMIAEYHIWAADVYTMLFHSNLDIRAKADDILERLPVGETGENYIKVFARIKDGVKKKHLEDLRKIMNDKGAGDSLDTLIHGVHAWGHTVKFIGPALFSSRLCSPLIEVMQIPFNFQEITVRRAAQKTWRILVQFCTNTTDNVRHLLLRPVQYTLEVDKNLDVKLAAIETWRHHICPKYHSKISDVFDDLVVPLVDLLLSDEERAIRNEGCKFLASLLKSSITENENSDKKEAEESNGKDDVELPKSLLTSKLDFFIECVGRVYKDFGGKTEFEDFWNSLVMAVADKTDMDRDSYVENICKIVLFFQEVNGPQNQLLSQDTTELPSHLLNGLLAHLPIVCLDSNVYKVKDVSIIAFIFFNWARCSSNVGQKAFLTGFQEILKLVFLLEGHLKTCLNLLNELNEPECKDMRSVNFWACWLEMMKMILSLDLSQINSDELQPILLFPIKAGVGNPVPVKDTGPWPVWKSGFECFLHSIGDSNDSETREVGLRCIASEVTDLLMSTLDPNSNDLRYILFLYRVVEAMVSCVANNASQWMRDVFYGMCNSLMVETAKTWTNESRIVDGCNLLNEQTKFFQTFSTLLDGNEKSDEAQECIGYINSGLKECLMVLKSDGDRLSFDLDESKDENQLSDCICDIFEKLMRTYEKAESQHFYSSAGRAILVCMTNLLVTALTHKQTRIQQAAIHFWENTFGKTHEESDVNISDALRNTLAQLRAKGAMKPMREAEKDPRDEPLKPQFAQRDSTVMKRSKRKRAEDPATDTDAEQTSPQNQKSKKKFVRIHTTPKKGPLTENQKEKMHRREPVKTYTNLDASQIPMDDQLGSDDENKIEHVVGRNGERKQQSLKRKRDGHDESDLKRDSHPNVEQANKKAKSHQNQNDADLKGPHDDTLGDSALCRHLVNCEDSLQEFLKATALSAVVAGRIEQFKNVATVGDLAAKKETSCDLPNAEVNLLKRALMIYHKTKVVRNVLYEFGESHLELLSRDARCELQKTLSGITMRMLYER